MSPARTAGLAALLVLAGLAEGVGILTLLPLLELATSTTTAEGAALSRWVRAAIDGLGVQLAMVALLTLILVAISLKALLLWTAMQQIGRTASRVGTELRLQLLEAMLSARWDYFDRRPIGHFAAAIGMEAHRASMAYVQLGAALAAGCRLAIYSVFMIVASWRLALVVVAMGAFAAATLGWLVRASRHAGERQTLAQRTLMARLTEGLLALEAYKAMGQDGVLWARLRSAALDLDAAQQRQVMVQEALRRAGEPIAAAVLAIGLVLLLVVEGQSVSVVIVLAVLAHRMLGAIHDMQANVQSIAGGESALQSLGDLTISGTEAREARGQARRPPALIDGIELRSLSFSHGEQQLIQGWSAILPACSISVLTGPSGIGKTTIAELLLGLRRPHSGDVYIDGVPLGSIDLLQWRALVGYVPQDAVLLRGTIAENVACGDESIGPERIEAALRDAEAWDFVQALQDGVAHIVEEQGADLSGGQRQRIALARALARRPRLLLLDEATAGLDAENEAAILRTLTRIRDRMTIVSISHRASMLDVADVIVELSDMGPIRSLSSALDKASVV